MARIKAMGWHVLRSSFAVQSIGMAIIALITACGGDDPAKPDVSQGYRIQASLLADMQTASVTVIRLDAGDPSATGATVLLDDVAVAPLASSTPDHAVFRQQVAPELARAHSLSVTIEGKTASGILMSVDEASSITITEPAPGVRTFSPDVPLTLEWDYIGSEPEEFGVFGANIGITRLVVVSDTLKASARSAVVQTAQWAFAPQILLRVTARSKSEIAGDLAALGSFSQVEFAVTEMILNRR